MGIIMKVELFYLLVMIVMINIPNSTNINSVFLIKEYTLISLYIICKYKIKYNKFFTKYIKI